MKAGRQAFISRSGVCCAPSAGRSSAQNSQARQCFRCWSHIENFRCRLRTTPWQDATMKLPEKMCRVVCRRSMSRDAASLLPASIPCNIKLRLRDASGYCQQRPRILTNYIAELDLFREHIEHLPQQCSAFLTNPSSPDSSSMPAPPFDANKVAGLNSPTDSCVPPPSFQTTARRNSAGTAKTSRLYEGS